MKREKESKLYLGELIERDCVEFSRNNLIKSPVGSGKTFLVNSLSQKYKGRKLMLVSSTALKDKVSMSEGRFTSQTLRRSKIEITDEDIHVMTYAEFGERIKWSREFLHEFSVVFCDEIHSLFDYFFIARNFGLGVAIGELFDRHENITKFYFTATTHEIDRFIDKEYDDLYRNVKIVDYYDSKEIVKYVAYFTKDFTGTHEVEEIIVEISGMKYSGKKGVIYNDRIDGMESIENLLKMKGLDAISIWSINNTKKPMSKEQLRVRDFLLREERIPDEYDFIIINGAMREGWDLKDPDVEFVVLNTLNETSKEQALGRVRKDIAILYRRIDGMTPLSVKIMNKERELELVESVLGKPIDTEVQDSIAEIFNIRREENNVLYKWQTISRVLCENGYSIESKRIRENGRQKTFQIVTKDKSIEESYSTAARSSSFIRALKKMNFLEENEEFFDRYIGKNESIALAHIRNGHERFVSFEKWSERKFVDVIYLLVRDERMFSSENFIEYGVGYKSKDELEILTERAKYEKGAQTALNKLTKNAKDKSTKSSEKTKKEKQ